MIGNGVGVEGRMELSKAVVSHRCIAQVYLSADDNGLGLEDVKKTLLQNETLNNERQRWCEAVEKGPWTPPTAELILAHGKTVLDLGNVHM